MAQPLIEGEVDAADLAQALASFSDAARRLESSYAELKERAASIDLELHRSNAALQSSLAERDRLLAALPLGVAAFDAQGQVVWCNEASRRLLDADDARVVAVWTPGEREVRGRRVLVRTAPMDGGGRLVLLEDRSQVARLEREVDRLDRLAGLSELALGIAHEIKNPLNGACGFAALLQRSSEPTEMRRYAQRVGEGLAQVDRIVRELLAFACPGASARRPLPVCDAIDEAALAANLPRDRVHTVGAVEQRVEGAALVRVLTNLLRNAAEAAGEGVRVHVRVARTASHGLEIVVADNGPGVPSELAPRLFQPFVSSKATGYGLGLALSARVLSFLHGSLTLLNPGQPGAKFQIDVPCIADAEAAGGA